MSPITIQGEERDAEEVSNEVTAFNDMLVKITHIDQPLPPDTDLTEEEDKESQTQLRAVLAKPSEIVEFIWAAFCAKHLNKMANILRTLSLENQPKAFATYVQIMSLFPEPSTEPYWRMFLCSPDSNGITNIVGNAFVQGVRWRHPSGPGFICGTLIELLTWCDTSQGDDKKASMDSAIRKAVARKTREIMASDSFQRLDENQQGEIQRLGDVLDLIENEPEDSYLSSTKDKMIDEMERLCGNEDCNDVPIEKCERCQSVEYCDRLCQLKHWEKEHKVRCFERLS
ncbi:hypothetical protein FRC08_014454 [Ceratobasidium sp. 394]|nr:hypothetical protein FRC08_014454 [Ceratobasidium sp. 394]